MLEIRSDKGLFDLDKNTRVSFVQDFNLHNFENIGDVRSWRFKLAKTANNQVLLNWQSADSPQGDHFINVHIILFGKLYRSGPLYLLEEDDTHYHVTFTGQLGALLTLIEGKNIRDFNYPVPAPASMYAHALNTVTDPQGTHDYVFGPVDLPSLEGEVWFPAQINSVVVDGSGNLDQFPQYYTHFEDIDPYVSGQAYANGAQVMFNDKFYQANSPVSSGSSNDPVSNPSQWDQLTLGNIRKHNPLVPFLYVHAILQHIATELGISITGNLWDDPEIQRLVFFNTWCINPMPNDEPGLIPANTPIKYANHLPDISLRQLLKELAKLFNQRLEYKVEDKTLHFTQRQIQWRPAQEHLKDKVISWHNLFAERRAFNLSYQYSNSDVDHASDQWTGSLEGMDAVEEATDVVSEFSTLPMAYGFTDVDPAHTAYPGDDDNSWHPGLMYRPVSSLRLRSEVPRQLLFYRGLHTYTGGPWVNDPEIPQLASNLQYTPVSGALDKYTLYWKGTGGLYESFWKSYLQSLSLGRVLKMKVILEASTFSLTNMLQAQALHQFITYIEELEFQAGQDTEKVVAELQVLRL